MTGEMICNSCYWAGVKLELLRACQVIKNHIKYYVCVLKRPLLGKEVSKVIKMVSGMVFFKLHLLYK